MLYEHEGGLKISFLFRNMRELPQIVKLSKKMPSKNLDFDYQHLLTELKVVKNFFRQQKRLKPKL